MLLRLCFGVLELLRQNVINFYYTFFGAIPRSISNEENESRETLNFKFPKSE
jgi:hypothetical protein